MQRRRKGVALLKLLIWRIELLYFCELSLCQAQGYFYAWLFFSAVPENTLLGELDTFVLQLSFYDLHQTYSFGYLQILPHYLHCGCFFKRLNYLTLQNSYFLIFYYDGCSALFLL
jgi:hypothetical protein